jgi:alkylation response protein AidB-like acyl-CoA dehydrogenase
MKDKTETFMKRVTHTMYDGTETAEFPFWVADGIAKLGISKADLPLEVGGRGMNVMDSGAIMYELAKGDASVATFYLLHHSLGQYTVLKLA